MPVNKVRQCLHNSESNERGQGALMFQHIISNLHKNLHQNNENFLLDLHGSRVCPWLLSCLVHSNHYPPRSLQYFSVPGVWHFTEQTEAEQSTQWNKMENLYPVRPRRRWRFTGKTIWKFTTFCLFLHIIWGKTAQINGFTLNSWPTIGRTCGLLQVYRYYTTTVTTVIHWNILNGGMGVGNERDIVENKPVMIRWNPIFI